LCLDKFSDALMKPISMVDRFVITRLFGACQVQIQKETGLKVGTEENKIKAGELLQRIILETQQNSFATERSEAMRNSDEILKTFTMFSADSMKVVGRVIDSIGEVSVLKAKIRQETNESTKKALEEELKIAKKKAGKSVVALGSIAIFMAAISQAFKFLYNKKKDEDENIALNMSLDAVGNLLGGLPLIKDLYGNIVDGYDINNYAYSTINDLLDSFNSVLHNEGKTAQQIRNVVNAIGQLYGVPTRNIYNVFYGITSRIGTTGYTLDNLFYNQTYSSDLLKAIEDNDDDLANKIVNLMLDSKNVSIEDDGIKDIMKDLYGKGYNVFPKTINETIIYDGEAIELTKSQQKEFKAIYSKANDKVNALTKNSKFKMLEPEVKAKSIKYIYNYYYDEGIKNLLGVESDEKKYLFAQAIDISNLAMIVSKISQITSDKDKKGKTISGSKKTKIVNVLNSMNLTAVQKYMLMGYFGYKNLNGELQVKKYIQSLKLTKNEKETLFSMSGY